MEAHPNICYNFFPGVLMANLTLYRKMDVLKRLKEVNREYHSKIRLGDQDLINILLAKDSRLLMVLPCQVLE